MTNEPVRVTWQISSDESMSNIVTSGTTVAAPQLGHSVHVEAQGLEPDRWYGSAFAQEMPKARSVELGPCLAPIVSQIASSFL